MSVKISELINLLQTVKEDVGDKEVGVKTMVDGCICIEEMAGVCSSGFEGVNISTFED